MTLFYALLTGHRTGCNGLVPDALGTDCSEGVIVFTLCSIQLARQ
jgi:hypothetical protein